MPIKKSYLFDPDILAILFDARPATQVPFLRKAINVWNESNFNGESIAKFVVGTIKKILSSGDAASSDAKDNWISVAKQYVTDKTLFEPLSSLGYHSYNEAYKYEHLGTQYINKKEAIDFLKINEIIYNLAETFNNADEISKLRMHLAF